LKLLRVEGQRFAAAKRRPSAVAQVRLPWSLSNTAPSLSSGHEPWPQRQLDSGGDRRLRGEGEHLNCCACWLTFELRGRSRRGAWPAKRMMTASASRAKCHAGGGPSSSEGLGRTLMGPRRLGLLGNGFHTANFKLYRTMD
jgi:hypothetical protein